MKIIALTGYRGVGKTTLARHMAAHHGYAMGHPFAPWKRAVSGLMQHVGASSADAESSVNGSLRDNPSAYLPSGESPRDLLEELGRLIPDNLGSEYTVGLELHRLIRSAADRVVFDSIVHESDYLRAMGASIIHVSRPGAGPRGLPSDEAVERVAPDMHFINDFASPNAAGEALVDALKADGLI